MASGLGAEYAEVVETSAAAPNQEATMKVAGIDAHTTYIVVAIVGNEGELLEKTRRIGNEDREGLVAWLRKWQPGEVVVEASGSWPWLYELIEGEGFGFVLAHPK